MIVQQTQPLQLSTLKAHALIGGIADVNYLMRNLHEGMTFSATRLIDFSLPSCSLEE